MLLNLIEVRRHEGHIESQRKPYYEEWKSYRRTIRGT